MENSFGDILKEIRISRNMTQDEMASLLGTTKQVISRYENNQRTPKVTVANEYAIKLNIPLNTLLGDNSVPFFPDVPFGCEPLSETVKLPLLRNIVCSESILAEQNIEKYVDAPQIVHADFCLRCKDDTMLDARIHSGDIVYVRAQSMVENGQIAVVRIGGELILKRAYLSPDSIVLQPANSLYAPTVYNNEEMNKVCIEGKAVGFFSCL